MPHEVPPVGALAQGASEERAGEERASEERASEERASEVRASEVGASAHGAVAPMALALEAARAAGRRGEVPVGAVVTDAAGRVLAVAGNRMREDRDAAAHAEMIVMRHAARIFPQGRLDNCDLWITLEPCPMCAAAVSLFRIRRICFGAYDPKGGGIDHGPRVFQTMPHAFRPDVVGGIQESESQELLQAFFKMLRDGAS